tara:strand:- start:714 stop:1727 length:1014 start_codon:yes stop_codon:yes gene_type:complete
MRNTVNRRHFIKTTAVASIGISSLTSVVGQDKKYRRIGVIGLDTSHSIEFSEIINDPSNVGDLEGFKVVAAYPYGSNDIESTAGRIPKNIEKVMEMGIEVTDSIQALLEKVDFVLLETYDGRLHLGQALEVLKAGKPMFIDKPFAASLSDAIAIFRASDEYNIPVFSSSPLRYISNIQATAKGETVGAVNGATAYSPAFLEKTHPDLFWYGTHGVEILYTMMGKGCKSVIRTHTTDTDLVVGTWYDDRIGVFRGMRSGRRGYGGVAFGEKGISEVGGNEGYTSLVKMILQFFRSKTPPVSPLETLEIYTFMEAADESKRRGGVAVNLEAVFREAGGS